MLGYEVRKIAYDSSVKKFISDNHYTETTPNNCRFCFGLFDGDKLIGVLVVSRFSRIQSEFAYYGYLELSRLFVVDGTPKNTESFFIGAALREIRKDEKVYGIISYADTTEGHTGTIYRAANFKEIKRTKCSYHYATLSGERIHKMQVWIRAQKSGRSETEQARVEGLVRIPEKPKIVFKYEFKKSPDFSSKVPEVVKADNEFSEIDIHGSIVLVDNDDLHLIKNHAWFPNGNGYFFYWEGDGNRRKRVYLHRLINRTAEGFICDHINRKRNDNRKCNLRQVDGRINNANKEPKGRFKGVRKKRGLYEASLTFDRKFYYLGMFSTEIEAAAAYDKKAVELLGNLAVTNFPIDNYVIPENPTIQQIHPRRIRRYQKRRECQVCGKIESAGSGLCKKHLHLYLNKQERNPDGNGVHHAKHLVKQDPFCSVEGCNRKTFARNLCGKHYNQKRKEEGYVRKEKKKYYCSISGCESVTYKEKLCIAHWKEKNDISPKAKGRRKKERGVCIICGEKEIKEGFCTRHDRAYWFYKGEKRVEDRNDFKKKVDSGVIALGKVGYQGRSGERYIRESDGRYQVVIERKSFGYFPSLSEAVVARDDILSRKDSEKICDNDRSIDMKCYELHVHSKQGDDLANFLSRGKTPVEGLRLWGDSLVAAGERVKEVASRLVGVDLEIQADTHLISLDSDQKEVLEKLASEGLIAIVEWRDEN